MTTLPTQPSEGETPRSEHIQALLACQPITAAPHAILVIGELRAQLQALQSAARKVVEAWDFPVGCLKVSGYDYLAGLEQLSALLPPAREAAPPPSVPTVQAEKGTT